MNRFFFPNLRARWHAAGLGAAVMIGCMAVQADPDPPAPAPAIPSNPGAPPVLRSYSPGMQEIVKLAQAGVTKDVLVAFINNDPTIYHPTADEIVYLNDLGVSDEVITALLKKGGNSPVPSAPPPRGPPPGQTPPADPPPQFPPPDPATQPLSVPPPAGGPTVPLPANPAPTVPDAPVLPAAPTAPPAPTTAAAPPATVSPAFYNALSPYGAWVTLPGYGAGWRPAVAANPLWRPYLNSGRWVYTDSGWYWHSDYSWGWAPFHYGRWYRHATYGWVWLPGSAWGPAWVSWRYADGYCGWAPLPPEAEFVAGTGFVFHGGRASVGVDFGLSDSFYAFVPVGRFCDPYPWRFVVGVDSARAIFRTSLVCNNYAFRGGALINEGIGRERIGLAAHINIPLVRITESHDFVRGGFRHGEEIHVYRPRVEGRDHRL